MRFLLRPPFLPGGDAGKKDVGALPLRGLGGNWGSIMAAFSRYHNWRICAVAGLGLLTPLFAQGPVEGVWTGRVVAPQGPAEIGLAFKRTPQGLTAALYMPVMHVYGLNLGPVGEAGSTLTLGPLDTVMTLEADKIAGTFALGRLPMELHRGGSFAPEPPPPAWPAGPAPRWTRSLGAAVWASPAVRDGVVYVGAADGRLHAVRVADGGEVWTWAGPRPLYGEALVAGEVLYVVDDRSDLICLDRADGHLRWRVPLHDPAAGDAALANKSFTHRTPVPVVAEGTVYVGSVDGGFYALDAVTGRTRWRHEAGAPIYAGATPLGREALVVGCFDGTVLTLDRGSGAELTRVRVGGPVASAPVVAGDIAIVGSRDYLLYGVNLARAAVTWRYSYWFLWVESSPRLVDGVAYVGSSDFRRVGAFDPATGIPLWLTDVRGMTWGTPVVTSHTVYAGTQTQRAIFLHHEGGIVAMDRRTGAVKWRVAIGLSPSADRAGCIGALAFAGDTLIAAAYDGTLAGYPAE
jgi:outer membrane protein assembly factor BamB